MRSLVATFPIFAAGGESLALAGGASVWIEGLGLVTISTIGSTYPSELYAVQLDGRAIRIGGQRAVGASAWTALGWGAPTPEDRVERFAAVQNSSGWRRMILPATMPTAPAHSAYIAASSFAVVADRVLFYSSGDVWAVGYDADASEIEAADLDAAPEAGAGAIAARDLAGGRSEWWAITLADGRVRLYDANAKAEIVAARTSLDVALTHAAYSRKLDLFFGIKAGELRIYANEPAAATLEHPTISAPLRAGAARVVSARLLGSDGEPCAGRVITFNAPAGTIERASVVTDAAGVASTIYQAPFSGAPSVAVTATLAE